MSVVVNKDMVLDLDVGASTPGGGDTNLMAIQSQIDQLDQDKANAADLAAVATSGSYNDLSDKPPPSSDAVRQFYLPSRTYSAEKWATTTNTQPANVLQLVPVVFDESCTLSHVGFHGGNISVAGAAKVTLYRLSDDRLSLVKMGDEVVINVAATGSSQIEHLASFSAQVTAGSVYFAAFKYSASFGVYMTNTTRLPNLGAQSAGNGWLGFQLSSQPYADALPDELIISSLSNVGGSTQQTQLRFRVGV